MKKTIYITISDGEVSKNILHTDVFPLLEEKVHIVLLVAKNKVEYFSSLLKDRAHVEAMPVPAASRIEEFFSDLFLYSVPTESILIKIKHSYASGGSRIGKGIKMALWLLGHLPLYRWFFRRVYQLMPDSSFDDVFARIPPDAIFAANLTSMDDARLLRAASRRGIASIGMPKGWDNLTLKTFLPVFPGQLLVQTEAMKGDAVFLGYPEDAITAVGFPKFDVYAESTVQSRQEFCARFGFDPQKKIILYAGAGDQLAPHDEEILNDLFRAIERNEVVGSPQVIVRPHPKYAYRTETLTRRDFWVLDAPGTTRAAMSDFEFSKADVLHLMHSLKHADVLIHTASTLGVEAAILDTPVIALAYDGDANVPPDISIARYYRYTHMRRAVAAGGMKVVYLRAKLIEGLNTYLADPHCDHDGRTRLVETNAHHIDGKAGMRVAAKILDIVGVAGEGAQTA